MKIILLVSEPDAHCASCEIKSIFSVTIWVSFLNDRCVCSCEGVNNSLSSLCFSCRQVSSLLIKK